MFPDSLIATCKRLSVLLGIFLVVAIVRGGMQITDSAVALQDRAPERTVVLTGVGEVDAAPTSATVVVSLVENGNTVATVTEKAHTTMAAVQAAVKAAGIADADVQTNAYQLNPQYDYSKDGGSTITGYQLSQSVEVTIRDTDKISDVIDGATVAGANSVSTPQFVVDNDEELKVQAREKALENINVQKASYANSLHVKFGKIVAASESNVDGGPIMMYAEKGVADSSGSSAPIETGTNTVRVQMSVTYEIK